MLEFLEYPKAIYGPNGEEVPVMDAKEEAAQRAAWGAPVPQSIDAEQDDDEAPVRRRGRPPKAR